MMKKIVLVLDKNKRGFWRHEKEDGELTEKKNIIKGLPGSIFLNVLKCQGLDSRVLNKDDEPHFLLTGKVPSRVIMALNQLKDMTREEWKQINGKTGEEQIKEILARQGAKALQVNREI